MLLNTFCLFANARIISLRATVLLMMTVLIKAKVKLATSPHWASVVDAADPAVSGHQRRVGTLGRRGVALRQPAAAAFR